MIKIFPKSEVGENPEKGLAQMYKNGNLQNGIRVQMHQVQLIEIKETAEKGGDGNSKPANEKGNVNNRFMGILYRNGDTTANSSRAELLRKQNPNLNKMKKIGFRNDRHVITSEGKLAIGVDGRDECSSGALPLPLGGHRNFFSSGGSGLGNSGEAGEREKRESEARARKSKKGTSTRE
jgi:hypothetical protein